MKRIAIALAGLLPLVVFAQDDDVKERLRAAEQRLEQAAQEIAELNAQMTGDSLKQVIETMSHSGGQGRAMLGITISTMEIERDDGTTERSGIDPDGVVVSGVSPGGPAEQAGLQSGDIILALNKQRLTGHSVDPVRKLQSLLDDVAPGDTVSVLYRRGDFENNVQVVTTQFSPMSFAFAGPAENYGFHADGEDFEVGKLMNNFAGFGHLLSKHSALRGLELVSLTPELGRYFDADRGLLVVRVPDDSRLSLEEGDVILSIAGATPDSPPEAMRLLRFYEPGDEVVMEVRRQKRDRTVKVAIPE